MFDLSPLFASLLCGTCLSFCLFSGITNAFLWKKVGVGIITKNYRQYSGMDMREKNNKFVVSINEPVCSEELSNENLVKIVNLEASDVECNILCWKCLGYRYDNVTETWNNEEVFPRWKEKYPLPPDLIGVERIYDPQVDQPVRDASVSLIRSIPRDFKGGVRSLVSYGFQPYKLTELTPNKTRRAQVSLLISYL